MKIFKEKMLTIMTFFVYGLAALLFEFGYCNESNCINLLWNGTSFGYNFSVVRIVMYISFFIILFFSRKKIFGEAFEIFKDKKSKRVILYVYSALTVVAFIIGIFIIRSNPTLIKEISTILIAILMGYVFLIGVSNNVIKNVIVTIFSIGMIFSIITDFNHAIDEKKHFSTAFNIAFGNFDYVKNPITDKRIESLDHLMKYNEVDNLLVNDYMPSITNDVNKDDVPSTPAEYNCVAYLFPALGILIARLLGGSIIDLYIMGRFFNLILYCILVCIAIKILPCKKNVFATVGLMPISLVLASTYSIDGFCIGIVSLFVAYCIKLKYNNDPINIKQAGILILLFILMLTAKSMAYIMVAFIVFCLPLKKTLIKYKKYIPIMLVVSLILFVGTFFVAKMVKQSNITEDPRAGENISVSGQIDYMIHNPLNDLKLGFNHIRDTFGSPNWYLMLQEDKFFSTTSQYILIPMLLFILYVAVTEDDYIFGVKDRVVLSMSFMLTFAMTSTILYLCFSKVGAEHIGGYQTRYILPILPLVLIGLGNKNLVVVNKKNRNCKIAMVSGLIIMLTIFQSMIKI